MSDERPFPPGDYAVVVVGTGPGGIQTSYELRRRGIDHALIGAEAGPGGMFRRFPLYGRLITWSRPHASVPRDSRAYYKFDWNSMLTDDPSHRALVAEINDGSAYFPTREDMARSLVEFCARAGVVARYDTPWLSTRREADGRFVLVTPDGEYRCLAAVFAIGMTEAWKPSTIPGIEGVPHYADLETIDPSRYTDKRVFIIGKRNSGYELADALLPVTQTLLLGSPHPSKPSITTSTPSAPRARYVQPLEDAQLAGGTVVLNCAIESVERTGTGYRVHTVVTGSGESRCYDVDEVIAATGFGTPLRDLPELGVTTFYKDRLPSQNHFWESASAPGIYFAGSVTQGQAGLRKYGIPSRSASVGGFRFNCGVQVRHLATEHLGLDPDPRVPIKLDDVVPFLLVQATHEPGLWHQQSHLARLVSVSPDDGIHDEGLVPLAHFVDCGGPDGIAITVETDNTGSIQPAVYIRHRGETREHLLAPDPMQEFETDANRHDLSLLLKEIAS